MSKRKLGSAGVYQNWDLTRRTASGSEGYFEPVTWSVADDLQRSPTPEKFASIGDTQGPRPRGDLSYTISALPLNWSGKEKKTGK